MNLYVCQDMCIRVSKPKKNHSDGWLFFTNISLENIVIPIHIHINSYMNEFNMFSNQLHDNEYTPFGSMQLKLFQRPRQ